MQSHGPVTKRVLFLANHSAGSGCDDAQADALATAVAAGLGATGSRGASVETALLGDHAAIRAAAAAWATGGGTASDRDDGGDDAALVVGGGGGTLRAAVEGVCQAREAARQDGRRFVAPRIAALRMGSGNLVARLLGVPADPHAAAVQIGRALGAGQVRRLPIMQLRVGVPGNERRLHAIGLGGFGTLGHTPSDLARLDARWPSLRKRAAAAIGLERWTICSYVAMNAGRALAALFRGCAAVSLRAGGKTESLRLLAGALLALPVPSVPVAPRREPDGSTLPTLHLLTSTGRHRAFVVRPDAPIELRLLDCARTTFFLDEDPESLDEQITIEHGGTLGFVPLTQEG